MIGWILYTKRMERGGGAVDDALAHVLRTRLALLLKQHARQTGAARLGRKLPLARSGREAVQPHLFAPAHLITWASVERMRAPPAAKRSADCMVSHL